jgi:hypothetical protein
MAIYRHLGDTALLHLVDELRVDHLAFGDVLDPELVEYSHEHKRHDEPDGDILYDVVQNPVLNPKGNSM